ncbi:MAG: hypothetical protein Kow0037_03060 [Calditrichia bacterium]
MRTVTSLILLLLCIVGGNAQPPLSDLAHTYSIVAVDSVTGEIGAAVQSHWFSVGSLVIWAEAGVGAVATQSFVNPMFGPEGLRLMREGKSAPEALKTLVEKDEGRDFRQVAMIDHTGRSAAFTGLKCIAEAGHRFGPYYSVQANMMLNATVWSAMEEAFLNSRAPLAERLLAALEAAEKEGGDIRGRQSAAILVVRPKSTGKVWQDVLVDLRVEDHPEPVKELSRLLKVHRAYEHMNAGDLAVENGDEQKALKEYGMAMKLQPDNLEMKYWTAVSLVNMGNVNDALPLFQSVFQADNNWRLLTPRLVPNGLLKTKPGDLEKIVNLP